MDIIVVVSIIGIALVFAVMLFVVYYQGDVRLKKTPIKKISKIQLLLDKDSLKYITQFEPQDDGSFVVSCERYGSGQNAGDIMVRDENHDDPTHVLMCRADVPIYVSVELIDWLRDQQYNRVSKTVKKLHEENKQLKQKITNIKQDMDKEVQKRVDQFKSIIDAQSTRNNYPYYPKGK